MVVSSFRQCLLWTTAAVASHHVVTATPSIQVLTQADNAHLMQLANKFETNEDSIDTFCQFPTADTNAHGRQVGVALLDRALGVGLKQAAGIHPFAPDAEFSSLQETTLHNQVRSVCSILTQSSHRHADSLRHLPDASDDPHHFQPAPVDGDTSKAAFVFLESNPDAYFSWGDYSFPVEKGNMVVFDGSVPHQTIIHKGTVQLLGPFDAATFRLVGPGGLGLGDLFGDLFGGDGGLFGGLFGDGGLFGGDGLPFGLDGIFGLLGILLPGGGGPGETGVSEVGDLVGPDSFLTNTFLALAVICCAVVAGVLTATAVGVL